MLRNYVVLLLSLPLLLLPAAHSLAQPEEKPEQAKAEDNAASRDDDTITQVKAPARKKSAVPEIFIPSETISEDLSVSFPIDI